MPSRATDTHHLLAAFAQSAAGMALVSLQGQWIEVNAALCRILGYPREALLTMPFLDLTHPADLDGELALMRRALDGDIDSYHFEKRYSRSDGTVAWGLSTVTLSRDEAGRPACFLVQVLDISAQKKALEDRDALFEVSPDLLSICTPDGYLSQVNPAWHELLGWDLETVMSRPFLAFIHPDDAERTLAQAQALANGGSVLGFRNRHSHADGSWRWIEWNTRVASDGRMFCSGRDVSEQVENEERLRSQERKIRLLIDNASDAFVGMNEAGIVTEWNKQAEAMFGWSTQEAVGQPMVELIMPARMRQGHNDGMRNFLRSDSQVAPRKRVEVPALRKDGSEILVEMTVGMVPAGGERYFHAFMRDVSEQRRMSEELHYRATHDFLTGLPNRYEFMGRLQQTIEVLQREPRPLALLFIDLDGFKMVNDLCGHETGDAVLITFGRRLAAAVGRTDRVARLAGDEFVVLLDHLQDPWQEAVQLVDRILHAASLPYPEIAARTEPGATIGMALYQPGDSADKLISRADAAMYVAKNAGKNRAAYERDGQWVVRGA